MLDKEGLRIKQIILRESFQLFSTIIASLPVFPPAKTQILKGRFFLISFSISSSAYVYNTYNTRYIAGCNIFKKGRNGSVLELFDRIYGRKSREKSLWGKNFDKTVPGQV